jgi:4-hydroxy-tetrahydrodipicolinate synthase
MTRVRELCGDGFLLLAGDDHLAHDALVDPSIRAHGACSFVANLVPGAMASLVHAARHDRPGVSRELHEKLELLMRLVAVTTEETVEVNGEPLQVPQRQRNPVPVKTALQLLGVLTEGCRDPLMEMGPKGTSRVRSSLRLTARRAPEVLSDLARSFEVDVAALAGATRERTARSARERASA